MTPISPKFVPLYPLNAEIFSKIREKLPASLKKDSPDVYYQLQLQSLLYVSFNRYLTDLILELPATNSEKLFDDLLNITAEPEFTQTLAFELNKPMDDIINNYLQLIEKTSQEINK